MAKKAHHSDGYQIFCWSDNFGTKLCRQSAVTECWQNWARRVAEAKTDGINLSLRIDQMSNKVQIFSKTSSGRFGFDKSALTEIKFGA